MCTAAVVKAVCVHSSGPPLEPLKGRRREAKDVDVGDSLRDTIHYIAVLKTHQVQIFFIYFWSLFFTIL